MRAATEPAGGAPVHDAGPSDHLVTELVPAGLAAPDEAAAAGGAW